MLINVFSSSAVRIRTCFELSAFLCEIFILDVVHPVPIGGADTFALFPDGAIEIFELSQLHLMSWSSLAVFAEPLSCTV